MKTQKILSLLLAGIIVAGCSSSAPVGASASGAGPAGDVGDVEAVAAAIQRSADWNRPSCRWLKYGVWVLAHPQEEKLYRAAHEVGFIEMEQIGTANRYGWSEPAWKITLTEKGQAEAVAECPTETVRNDWGVPVAYRRFISASFYRKQPYPSDLLTYSVEFEWMPTQVGTSVLPHLTSHQAVQHGRWRTFVHMRQQPAGKWQLYQILGRDKRLD